VSWAAIRNGTAETFIARSAVRFAMSEVRRFTRFRPGTTSETPVYSVVPDDGMCLSAFVVIHPPSDSRRVLLGRIDPRAPWLALGALDATRAAAVGEQWMLPSSQLLLFESPSDAAQRVVREQLEGGPLALEGPAVFSEAYRRTGSTAHDPHWDVHFVFRGRWPSDHAPRASPWKELAFVDLAAIHGTELARGQGDVLTLAGLPPHGPEPPSRSGPA
jgi:hypothetical protein